MDIVRNENVEDDGEDETKNEENEKKKCDGGPTSDLSLSASFNSSSDESSIPTSSSSTMQPPPPYQISTDPNAKCMSSQSSTQSPTKNKLTDRVKKSIMVLIESKSHFY